MKKILLLGAAVMMIVSCKTLTTGKTSKVSEEKLRDYIGEQLSVLDDDFKIESCQLKIAYFKDVFAVKMTLKDNQEIVVIFKDKIVLTENEIEEGCGNEKLKSGIISKIRFYKDGEETIIEN